MRSAIVLSSISSAPPAIRPSGPDSQLVVQLRRERLLWSIARPAGPIMSSATAASFCRARIDTSLWIEPLASGSWPDASARKAVSRIAASALCWR